jgi:hypothetical protein
MQFLDILGDHLAPVFCHGPRPMRSRAFTAPSPCVLR